MTVEKYKCMLDDISLLLLRLVSGKILKILFSFKLFPVGRQVEFKSMLDLTGDEDFLPCTGLFTCTYICYGTAYNNLYAKVLSFYLHAYAIKLNAVSHVQVLLQESGRWPLFLILTV